MPTVLKANKREVPGDMPPLLWYEKVLEYEGEAYTLPYFNPVMETLSPPELARFRAKLRVWWEITGEFPEDISCWWEPRQARRRGDVPPPERLVVARMNPAGDVRCGYCRARHSAPVENERCNLCGSMWIVLPESQEDSP